MTSDESKFEILKKVQEGVLSPQEGADLLGILDGNLRNPEPVNDPVVESSIPYNKTEKPEVAWYWKAAWSSVLWIGVALTVLSAYWMFNGYEAAGLGWGFFLSWIPLAIGILLIVAGARQFQAHWMFVKVNTSGHEGPQKIEISMPLPLNFAAWVFKNFGQYMPEEVRDKHVDEMLVEIEKSIQNDEVFQVNVDDDKNGDKVEVFIA
jgi:hypothetical protein